MKVVSTTPALTLGTGPTKVVTTYEAVRFGRLFINEFQKKGTQTAEIRQTVVAVSTYPSTKTETTLQNNLFDNEEFGFQPKDFDSKEERVAWLIMPMDVATDPNDPNSPRIPVTEQMITDRIAKDNLTDCCIYKVLSNEPVFDENQEYAIAQGLKTKDQLANKQAVRYPDTPDNVIKQRVGKLVLDKNGNVQYRRTFYWKTNRDDANHRNAAKVYLTAEIQAELKGAAELQGQSLLNG